MAPKSSPAPKAKEGPAAKKPKVEQPKAKAVEPKAKAEAPKKAEEPKPKAEEPKAEEKEAPKVGKDAEMEEKKEEPKEKEQDAPKETRPTIAETAVVFDNAETTLNMIPTTGGRVLMAMSDGGMQYLIAGARANVGLKAGRYFYEVKVIEALTPSESGGKGRIPMPRQLVRLGFSAAGSSLLLGDGDGSVCFESEGFFLADKKRYPAAHRFSRDQVIGVLLNLDPKSPNANTVSLFIAGKRASEPQPIPESMQGQPLFPHVSFRNVSVQMNFGPDPMAPLPFKCHMLKGAAKADVKVVETAAPKDGKYDVLFPVAFPDQGTFEWLDDFLEKNKKYVELSDRKIQEWAIKSGIWKPKNNSWKSSNDKPDFNFGIPSMDDMSVRRAINSIAAVVPRHYVVMEVKQNLVKADRSENLKRFALSKFKKIAHVVMGEPKPEFVKKIQLKLLEEKKTKAENEWKVKKVEKQRKKQIALRQKQLAEVQAKRAADAKKRVEEAAKAKEAGEAKSKESEAEGKDKEKEGGAPAETKEEEAKPDKPEEEKKEEKTEEGEKKEEEKKDEDNKDEEKPEEAKEEDKEEDDEDEPMPEVELTDEEKKLMFKPAVVSDLSSSVLSSSFAQFSIPEKSEGFDNITFEWQSATASKEYLKKWVLEKKLTSRIEDLQPSDWFKTKAAEFQKLIQEYQAKQKEFTPKSQAEKSAPEGEVVAEKKSAPLDIMSVEDVCDIGSGEPLFANFTFEDWTLLTLRAELYLLVAGFQHDVQDPERLGIHESHIHFYYNRYFRKQLMPKLYGKDTITELVTLVKDTVVMAEKDVLALKLEGEVGDASILVKLGEENRRERQRRIDAGDETGRLKFPLLKQQQEKEELLTKQREEHQQQRQQQQASAGARGGAAPAGPQTVSKASAPAWPQQPQQPQSQQPSGQEKGGKSWGGGGGGNKGGGKSWGKAQQQMTYAPRQPGYAWGKGK